SAACAADAGPANAPRRHSGGGHTGSSGRRGRSCGSLDAVGRRAVLGAVKDGPQSGPDPGTDLRRDSIPKPVDLVAGGAPHLERAAVVAEVDVEAAPAADLVGGHH